MAILYKVDGSTENVTPENGSDFTLKELYKLLGCNLVQHVVLGPLVNNAAFIIDEEGKLKEHYRNSKASQIWYSSYPDDPNKYDFRDDYIAGDALLVEEFESDEDEEAGTKWR